MNKLRLALIVLQLTAGFGMGTAEAANSSTLCGSFRNNLRLALDTVANSAITLPKWEALSIHVNNVQFGEVGVEGTLFDIENRGTPDRVLSEDESLAGNTSYNQLYVLRSDPFSMGKKITVNSYSEIVDNRLAVKPYAVESIFNDRYGITMPYLVPISFEGKNYIMVHQDGMPPTPDTVLLTIYTGKPDMALVAEFKGDPSTIKLDVVCVVHAPHSWWVHPYNLRNQ